MIITTYQIAKQFTRKHADGVRSRINRLFELAKISAIDNISESVLQVALSNLRKKPCSPKMAQDDMPLVSVRTRNIYLRSAISFCRWMVRNKRNA